MACNCPIVATDVADIKEITKGVEGCYITGFDSDEIAEKIQNAINFNKRTQAREKMGKYDNSLIVKQIIDIYYKVLKLNK